ncbi:MAG: ATP-dependent RecD-like DNA helicase [Oscillospiraceae bacterium]|nr:ATP-dependent RecD-like DNA helicase [Oscillospiraceae bacterium]
MTLEGIVSSIVYRNEDNGYTVFDLESKDELITVVGELGRIDEGEVVLLEGSYINHPRFGMQFKAVYCEQRLPETAVSIERYLSSGVIKGIGPSLAKKIVNQFGSETLEIMQNTPEKLTCIKGISPKKCESIAQEFAQLAGVRRIMTYLSAHGVAASYAMSAYKLYGFEAIEIIEDNPYILCNHPISLSFPKVDEIASQIKFDDSVNKRICAGLRYILEQNVLEGHTCVPLDKLVEKAKEYLGATEQAVYEAYNIEIEEHNIVEYDKNSRCFVYLYEYYDAENYIAQRLGVLNAFMPMTDFNFENLIKQEELKNAIEYEVSQKEAINLALTKGLMILTGGPGTGKTTTLNAIISIYEERNTKVLLAAPTGRAAKRMSELTNRNAKTIHRLLEVDFDINGNLSFKHNESNTLKCDVIIVDEVSMLDTLLFANLLKALKLNCRIILVGDSDQLPSVGAGNILKCLIDSKRIRTITLTEIFRQAQESCIVTNAHKIVSGELPDLDNKKSDFFFFERNNPAHGANLIVDLCSRRLPEAYEYSPIDDIQVLSPTRKGILGTIELNKSLQAMLNPHSENKDEVKTMYGVLRDGDKVMQIKNNYDIVWKRCGESGTGIFNGDIGVITEINRRSCEITINFDGRYAVYPYSMLEQLELAYAVTVHKSQGSEFEAVILAIPQGFDNLCYRNLLYTAITRARKLLILVGTRDRVEAMVNNNRRTLRYTCLRHMIESEIPNEPRD